MIWNFFVKEREFCIFFILFVDILIFFGCKDKFDEFFFNMYM